ncbi:MAG: hypothetical protein IJ004_05410 [Clostridia bacterium]|nr:hypothetical protein [Clostridia bacterium]
MKLLRNILLLCLLLCFFAIPLGASQVANQEEIEKTDGEVFDFKDYLVEKILPVALGVLTASAGLFSALGTIKKSLSQLNEERADLKQRKKENSELLERERQRLEERTNELKAQIGIIPQLDASVEELKEEVLLLIEELNVLSKIVGIGTFKGMDVAKSSSGKKIYSLIEKSDQLFASIEKKLSEYKGVLEKSASECVSLASVPKSDKG